MGPYHFARMHALQRRPGIQLTIAETCSVDDHEWVRGEEAEDLRIVPSNGGKGFAALWEVRPDVVVAPGYSDPAFLAAMSRYRHDFPNCLTIVWSESTAADRKRNALKETLKSVGVSLFDGAFVAGQRHAQYLEQLGMPADRIAILGNCVDNDFFSSRVAEIRHRRTSPVQPFFLFVGRFIPEKNLPVLLESYAQYRQIAHAPWPLVLVGGGPQEDVLRQQVKRNAIDGVIFAGLRQPNELAAYYADAGCFVLPSASEPWGLVINEAMASGLPVIASTQCGSAFDLIQPEINGVVFAPADRNRLATLMSWVSAPGFPLQAFGEESQKAIARYTPDSFAQKADNHLRRLQTRGTGVSTRITHQLVQTAGTVWSRLSES